MAKNILVTTKTFLARQATKPLLMAQKATQLSMSKRLSINDKFTVNAWAYIEKWTDKATRLRINVDALNNGFDIVLNAQTTNLRFEYYGNEKRILLLTRRVIL